MQSVLNEIKYIVSTRNEPLPVIRKAFPFYKKRITIKLNEYLRKSNRDILYNIHSVYNSNGENYITISKKIDTMTFIQLRNLPYTPRGYFHNVKTNICSCRTFKFDKCCIHTKNYIDKIEEMKYYLILVMTNKFDNFHLAKFIFYETKNKVRLFNS